MSKDTLIKVQGTQQFMGKEIPVIAGGFGENCRVMLAKTIAEIHDVEVKYINKLINNNINRFRKDVDLIDLKTGSPKELVLELGFTNAQYGNANNIYLLSERGYAKLIKIMDTDLAWEIHDKLIDEYFQLREGCLQPPTSNLAELIKFIQLTRGQMKEQGCSPTDIAKVMQNICNQYGIQLPKYFVKPEETTLKEVYAMIDYICDQPRGRGIRRPTYEDFIAHQINVKLIGGN